MVGLNFALLREGTSDDGLVGHITALLIRAGANSVVGAPRSYKGSTIEKLRQVLAEPAELDLIFVHRDADARDPAPRVNEIVEAAELLRCTDVVVPVVPVQELEAWLLTDPRAIRSVVGRPSSNTALNIPSLRNIETTARPKEVLRDACLTASGKTGARLKKERAAFSNRRAALLGRLDIDGAVSGLASWQRFVDDLNEAAGRVLTS